MRITSSEGNLIQGVSSSNKNLYVGKFVDLTGLKFNRLLVIKRVDNYAKHRKVMWECICDCGCTKVVSSNRLKQREATMSCGCFGREKQAETCRNNFKTHGQSESLEYGMWTKAKERAIKKNIPFSIQYTDIVIPDVCPVLGIPIYKADKSFHPNSPSLDKFIPELGYIKGNINVVSNRANCLKSDATINELKSIVKWMEVIQNQRIKN